MALSHPLVFSIDNKSCLLILWGMGSSDYQKAYESAKGELAALLADEERIEKRKLELRKTIEVLAAICESEEVKIEPSQEAAYLLDNTTLADEIRMILRSHYPAWLRPHEVKAELERLGRDLSKYGNPQSAIHMVMKRMVESKEVQETQDGDQKQVYRCPHLWQQLSEQLLARGKGGSYKGGGYKRKRS
jgi:hypothetical protein